MGLDATGLEDLDRIGRFQFDHFVGQARREVDRVDWPTLRGRLLDALTAAGGIEWVASDTVPSSDQMRTIRRRATADLLLDQVRERHDPAQEWPAFRAALLAGWADLVAGQDD